MTNNITDIDTPEELEAVKERMGGTRKIVMSIVVLAIGIGMVLYRGEIPPSLLQLLEVVFGGFIASNVAGHVMGTTLQHAEIKYSGVPEGSEAPAPAAPVTQPADRTDEILSKLAEQSKSLEGISNALLMIINKTGLNK